jgi:hypothetical protein
LASRPAAIINQTVSLTPLSQGQRGVVLMRHCMWHLSASGCGAAPASCNADFDFQVVPALNGVQGAVSFRSVDFPTMFISPGNSPAPYAVGLSVPPTNKSGLDGASFAVQPGLLVNASRTASFSFRSLAGGFAASAGGRGGGLFLVAT